MSRRFWIVLSVATGSAMVVAALILPYPFMGDQALFAVFARMTEGGAVLYRDAWDVKQPGIFWFFQLAGLTFGVDEIGVHLLEAMFWLGSSVGLALMLRSHVRRAWVAALVPAATAGWYFGVARVNELTQIEALVGPLVGGVALLVAPSVRHEASTRWRWLAAGILSGLIIVFKFLLVLVPAAMTMVAVAMLVRRGVPLARVVRDRLVPFAAGVAVPLLALAVWVVASDLVDLARFTWFEYPPEAIGLADRPPRRLRMSFQRFTIAYLPLVALAGWRLVRPGPSGRALSVILLGAIVAGAVAVLLQLWWSYLVYIVAVPIGMLAVQGLDDLMERPRRQLAVAGALLLLLAFPAGGLLAEKADRFGGLVAGQSLTEYRSFHPTYAEALEAVDAVELQPDAGIYVLGDPLIMHVSDTVQAIPINGWAPQFWSERLWSQVIDDLADRPPVRLFVSDFTAELAARRSPEFLQLLDSSFDRMSPAPEGTWYSPARSVGSIEPDTRAGLIDPSRSRSPGVPGSETRPVCGHMACRMVEAPSSDEATRYADAIIDVVRRELGEG